MIFHARLGKETLSAIGLTAVNFNSSFVTTAHLEVAANYKGITNFLNFSCCIAN